MRRPINTTETDASSCARRRGSVVQASVGRAVLLRGCLDGCGHRWDRTAGPLGVVWTVVRNSGEPNKAYNMCDVCLAL